MTDTIRLGQLFASDGGSTTDFPSDAKYTLGWVSEIPTYQNFNYLLNSMQANTLHLAESGAFDWQNNITYEVGARVSDGSSDYFCVALNTNEQPTLDTLGNFWSTAPTYGLGTPLANASLLGLTLDDVSSTRTLNWDGSAMMIRDNRPMILFATNSVDSNYLLGNHQGFLTAIDVGNSVSPDGRDVDFADAGVYKVFHEGNPPTISQVPNGVEEVGSAGIWGRTIGGWVELVSNEIASSAEIDTGLLNTKVITPLGLEGSKYIDTFKVLINSSIPTAFTMTRGETLNLTGLESTGIELTEGGAANQFYFGGKQASTSQRGTVQLSTSLTSTSETMAPTLSAIKAVADQANAGMFGNIDLDASGFMNISKSALDLFSGLGLDLQWGTTTWDGNAKKTVSFNRAFDGEPYFIIMQARSDIAQGSYPFAIPVVAEGRTANDFKFISSGGNANSKFWWFAVGKKA